MNSQHRISAARRPQKGTLPPWDRRSVARAAAVLLAVGLAVAGCAKYNTYFNAKQAFDNAEHVREEALRNHQDPPQPRGQQKSDYETAIRKAQKILDNYPGHSLTDDALFLQAKAWHRLESYRMSIRKFDLLFTNFPATPFMEEALYLQGLNYLLIGNLNRSQDFLDRLAKRFPDSEFQAETQKVTGDNSFLLEDWTAAAESYREYLDNKAGDPDAERVALKLASCYWELQQYREAADVLQSMVEQTSSAELSFQARLLTARVHVRLGQYELVADLLAGLRDEAPVYNAQGEVALIEAESLLAQGRGQEASVVLENLPQEWLNPDLEARSADLLAYELMRRGEWELAKEKFQMAMRRKNVLDDPDLTRRLDGNLKDYLAAEEALADAQGERVARLKLLQANALLFGLERPGRAAQLYLEAAADSAADSLDAARALFGAMVAYRDHLDRPDSARITAAWLQERFPSSAQAFEAANEDGGRDLLGYLLGLRSRRQAENLAALSPEELAALQELGEGQIQDGRGRRATSGLRRRMVYLGRRENLVYPPPPQAVAAREARQQPASSGGGSGLDEAQGGRAVPEASTFAPADSLAGTSADLPGGVTRQEPVGGPDPPVRTAEPEPTTDDEEDSEAEREKTEQQKKWEILRSPLPGERPEPGT